MAAAPSTPGAILARKILALVDQLIKEHGHGQVVITVREGKVEYLDLNRKYRPENLPE